ncbi:MAG TPA: hypothetical protein VFT22_28550 [Kofleriaceae bacterium]|nr:hypothetical protein [Kofleriaceae bacterium]
MRILGGLSTGWHEADHPQRLLHGTAASVSAQLADDASHIRRHVLDDPEAHFDRLDCRTVAHANLAVQRLFDVVASPTAMVRGR